MVPMHLDLIEWPFVPHNLISVQESPVPLPKFQMSPRLTNLMSSGSKKGTRIYYPLLSKKSRQTNPHQVPQRGPYGERCLLTGRFYVSLDLRLYLKGTMKRASPPFSPKAGHVWKQTPTPERYLTYLWGSPVKEPSPEALCTEPLQRETLHHSYSPHHPSLKVPGR
jgi:hypothetical protein